MTTATQAIEWVDLHSLIDPKMTKVRRTGAGVLVPKGKEAQYQAAFDEAVEEHKAMFDKRTIILKEMINQELFYEPDNIRFVIQSVAKYGYTKEDVEACVDEHFDYAVANNW